MQFKGLRTVRLIVAAGLLWATSAASDGKAPGFFKRAAEGIGKVLNDLDVKDVGEAFQEVKAVAAEIGATLKETAKEAAEAVREAPGRFIDEATTEFSAEAQRRIQEALSEENIRRASATWEKLKDAPGVSYVAAKYRGDLKRLVDKHLRSLMTERSLYASMAALNATAEVANRLWWRAGRSLGAEPDVAALAEARQKVMAEASSLYCELENVADSAWKRVGRKLLPEYDDYASTALDAKMLPRIALPVSAAATHGYDPRRDPFLASLIVAAALGDLSSDLAENIVSFFSRAVVPAENPDASSSSGAREKALSAAVGKLLSPKRSCHQIGRDALEYFDMVETALNSDKAGDVAEPSAAAAHPPPEAPPAMSPGGWLLLWMMEALRACEGHEGLLGAGVAVVLAFFVAAGVRAFVTVVRAGVKALSKKKRPRAQPKVTKHE